MSVQLIPDDEKIIEFLETYGQVKRKHLEELFNIQRLNKLIRKGVLSEENDFVKLNNLYEPTFSNMHYAVELLVKFKDKITYHSLNQHPYLIFFIMNDKPYDVTVIEPGTEIMYKALIERSPAENVIAIIADPSQAEMLNTDKNMIFCTLEPFKMYKKRSGNIE